MEHTGTLVYDPVARATGKDRARIIRRHAHELAGYCRIYVPYLEGKSRRCANDLDQLLLNDPNYWIRRKGQVSAANKLNRLYQHAQTLCTKTELPAVSTLINDLVSKVEDQLVLTKKKPGWAILKLDHSSVEPYLQEIRGNGTRISCSVWGAHVSVMRGEHPQDKAALRQIRARTEGKSFKIETRGEIRRNRQGYYWLDVRAPALEALRVELGLPPRPSPPFHLTIGKAC